MQTAIAQVIRATTSCDDLGETELLEAFWEEVEEVKNGNLSMDDVIAALPEESGDAEPNGSTPPNGWDDGGSTIEVNSSIVEPSSELDVDSSTNENSQVALAPTLDISEMTPAQLQQLSRPELQKLASKVRKITGVLTGEKLTFMNRYQLIQFIEKNRPKALKDDDTA
jgi:hypothetical protein